jgi:hypothetical protein
LKWDAVGSILKQTSIFKKELTTYNKSCKLEHAERNMLIGEHGRQQRICLLLYYINQYKKPTYCEVGM